MATTSSKKIGALTALALLSTFSFAAHADKLADIKAAGVVKVSAMTWISPKRSRKASA